MKGFPPRAANASVISTFGKRTLASEPFSWTFILADVSQPIIGEDSFREHSILINLKHLQLCDPKHPTAAFLLTSLTSRHSTSPISLWCKIITAPFSKTFPISLLHKWLMGRQSMASSTALPLMAGHPLLRLVALPLKSCPLLRKSFAIFYSLASSSPRPVYGLHHCIWCPKSQVHGVPMVISVPSMTSPHLIDIPYLISKTSEHHYAEPQSSPRLTLSGPSTRFRCMKMISQRLQL